MKKLTLKQNVLMAVIGFALASAISSCKKDSTSKSASQSNMPVQAPAVMVSTIAGQIIGEPAMGGSTNGIGTAATFYQPFAIATDGNGNLYVTDNFNYLIRKITPSLVVTTFTGSGIAGFKDGPGTLAEFNAVYGIAIDNNGNFYIADTYNSVIRKINPTGVVSTFAGNPAGGGSTYNDGVGVAATFELPWGIAIDASGNLFVADNFTIRKITPAGRVTTFAGTGKKGSANGTASSASFNGLTGIAIDSQGNIYVNDYGNYMVRKITASGVVSTIAGNGSSGFSDGTGLGASFSGLGGIAVNSKGDIYVTDRLMIRQIDPAGVVVTIAGNTTGMGGQATDGTGKVATFNGPQGIAVATNGDLYVTDTNDNLIRKIVFQ